MSTTAKSARKKCCLALMSFVVVSAAVLYVWLPQGQALAVTVSQRSWEAADFAARADGREQAGAQRAGPLCSAAPVVAPSSAASAAAGCSGKCYTATARPAHSCSGLTSLDTGTRRMER